MKLYTVLEILHLINTANTSDEEDLGGWSMTCLSYDQAMTQLRKMVEEAVDDYYQDSGIEADAKAEIVGAILDDMDENEKRASWEMGDHCYVWRIMEDEVEDPKRPNRREKEDGPVKPEEARIGFKLKDKVTYEVYTYKFRWPAMAEAFAESIRRVMEPTTMPMGVFVWNPVKGERNTDTLGTPMTWDDLLNELRLAATPNSMFERTEVGAEMLSRRNQKYPEFYPGNVWSVLLKHTSTLVVNVKAKTLDEAIEKVMAKGETNDWFADYGIWAWDGDGEPVEVDRKSCHAAPGEEEDF